VTAVCSCFWWGFGWFVLGIATGGLGLFFATIWHSGAKHP